ncbi:4-hydroxy-tetrahydrodipicolinate reductase [Bacteroidota bacterium]|nr:4-hydroxy-tetrahydrodipicolinate reductase [Bacteroidota bacterium]
MKIALIGYGKMGIMIESIIKENGMHEIVFTATSKNINELTPKNFASSDAVIDFSVPSAVIENAKNVLAAGKPLIIGTTGWYEHMDELKKLCTQQNGCIVYGSNFSTGVNLFFMLNDFLSKLMKTQKKYHVFIEETHHTQKRDTPSGTAITIANSILENRKWLKEWTNSTELTDEDADETKLAIISNRVGDAIGEHVVTYYSENDSIQIAHEAFDRKGFAEGSIVAAEWALNKIGFYSFRDVLKEILANAE